MRTGNKFWKILSSVIFLALSIFFVSCASTGKNDSLIVKYMYNLNYGDYHVVDELYCDPIEENLYKVKKSKRHFFSKSNDFYKDRGGMELVDMIRTKLVAPTSSMSITQKKAVNFKYPGSEINLEIPAGMKGTNCFYF